MWKQISLKTPRTAALLINTPNWSTADSDIMCRQIPKNDCRHS